MATTFERLQKVIAEQLGVDREAVVPSASLIEDLNADSADLAELMSYIELEFSTNIFKFEIPDEEIERIVTVQDIIDLLKDHVLED
jgi:acyl carrier protein